jgi:hypothetical protein
MKITLKLADLIKALAIVSIVPPRPLTPAGGAGYLFVIRTGGLCSIYSRDALHVARATISCDETDTEGSFIFPSEFTSGFRFLRDDEITIESKVEADNFTVSWSTNSGAGADRASFDPKLMASCDRDLAGAKDERSFPVGLFKEAMTLAKPFLGKADDTRIPEHFKTLQLFDKSKHEWEKGSGHLFAANTFQAFWFYSAAFVDKGFSIHVQHMSFFTSFLAKSDGEVKLVTGDNMIFAVDSKGNALGWAKHEAVHGKFSYYSKTMDKLILGLPKSLTVDALRFMRSELDSKEDKITLVVNEFRDVEVGEKVQRQATMLFRVAETKGKARSFPLPAVVIDGSEEQEITFNVNIDRLIDLIDGVKGMDVQLRIAVIKADDKSPKERAMFRTIDEFLMDDNGKVVGDITAENRPEGSHECRVTRYMPSKD